MKRVGYFGADYCKACHAKRPLVEQTCKELGIDFIYIDVATENGKSLAAQYDVRSVPTLVVVSLDFPSSTVYDEHGIGYDFVPPPTASPALYRATGGLINRPALERALRAEANTG